MQQLAAQVIATTMQQLADVCGSHTLKVKEETHVKSARGQSDRNGYALTLLLLQVNTGLGTRKLGERALGRLSGW